MNSENKINTLSKQNNSIYESLLSKNVEYNRIVIDSNLDDETKIKLLITENENLKELSKKNRPVPPPKEEKKPVEKIIKKEEIEEEDNYNDPIKKYSTITNMEDIKRAFFNKDYELFENLVKEHDFKYYSANYKYSSDKDGSPEYIAKNLIKGFVRNMDDFRKYFLTCFRCYIEGDKKYNYPSLWIFNSNDKLEDVLGNLYEDFDFLEINDGEDIFKKIRRTDYNESSNLLEESYLH
jgi:hypothetical protein